MGNVSVPIDGNVLRALREDKMWSYARLAKEARDAARQLNEHSSLAAPTLWRAENDERPRLSRNNLRYVVGALRPSPTDLRRLLLGEEPPSVLTQLCSDAPGQPAAGHDPKTLAATAAQLDEIWPRCAPWPTALTLAQPRAKERTWTAPPSSTNSSPGCSAPR